MPWLELGPVIKASHFANMHLVLWEQKVTGPYICPPPVPQNIPGFSSQNYLFKKKIVLCMYRSSKHAEMHSNTNKREASF
jgi:hypothetical protein